MVMQLVFDSWQLKQGGLLLEGCELVFDLVCLVCELCCVCIMQGGDMDDFVLIEVLCGMLQGMVIVNSCVYVLELFNVVKVVGLDGLVYLIMW